MRWRDPPQGSGISHGGSDHFVGLPFAHVGRVGHDARTSAHVQYGRAQLQVEGRPEIQREHGRGAEVGLEYVALLELHLVGELLDAGVTLSQLDQLGLYSMPSALAPNCLAAAVGSCRPQARSITRSLLVTPAARSMEVTSSSMVATPRRSLPGSPLGGANCCSH